MKTFRLVFLGLLGLLDTACSAKDMPAPSTADAAVDAIDPCLQFGQPAPGGGVWRCLQADPNQEFGCEDPMFVAESGVCGAQCVDLGFSAGRVTENNTANSPPYFRTELGGAHVSYTCNAPFP
jgi:hypothetical protein